MYVVDVATRVSTNVRRSSTRTRDACAPLCKRSTSARRTFSLRGNTACRCSTTNVRCVYRRGLAPSELFIDDKRLSFFCLILCLALLSYENSVLHRGDACDNIQLSREHGVPLLHLVSLSFEKGARLICQVSNENKHLDSFSALFC